MKTETLDTTGLRFPDPLLEIVQKAAKMKPGSILEVQGDYPGFEKDVRGWCLETGRVCVSVEDEGKIKIVGILF